MDVNSLDESFVYKILTADQHKNLIDNDGFDGSEHDVRDGFIHLSAASQVAGTLEKHYAGQTGLLLVAVDPEMMGEQLRWEVSREDQKFPHLYGRLESTAVRWVQPIT
ncbi:MAG: DUF952 domain-containing protein [Planctomycetota bacterium]